MKTWIFGLCIVLLISPAFSQAASEPSLYDRYPHEELFRLSSGEKVFLPTHLTDYDAFYIVGTASLSKLNAILAPEDLIADETSPGSGVGTVVLHFIDNRAGEAGAYQEVAVVILARSNFPFQSEAKSGQFLLTMRVTTELAIKHGVEVWGDPKISAKMELSKHAEAGLPRSCKARSAQLVRSFLAKIIFL